MKKSFGQNIAHLAKTFFGHFFKMNQFKREFFDTH